MSAITSAALAQTAPTIVWYGTNAIDQRKTVFYRAWSDGRVEMRRVDPIGESINGWCYSNPTNLPCTSIWYTINNPNDGYSAASDSNFDAKVDGADLAMLLGNWGDAPRDQIPHSDCPLNLINP